MSLKIKFTNAGKAALVNPANIGTAAVDITEIRLGSANYDPTGTETDLQTTIKSLNTFGGVTVADDVIHVTIRDDSSDTYTIGEIGLYSGSGVLMGIISSAATAVITQKGPNDILLVSADAAVTEVDVTNLTFGPTDFIYPPATPTTQGVIEVADASEVQAGSPNKAVDAYELQQELTRRITSSLSDQSTTKMAAAKAVYDLNQAINQINTLLLSDTATLDTLQEIVDFIQLNRSDLNALTITSIAGLQAALNSKAGITHTHDASEINNLPNAGLNIDNLTLIWSGTKTHVRLDGTDANYPGNGFYLVQFKSTGPSGRWGLIYANKDFSDFAIRVLGDDQSTYITGLRFSMFNNLYEFSARNHGSSINENIHKIYKVG